MPKKVSARFWNTETRNGAMNSVDHDSYSDAYIRDILATVKSVAVVGASANKVRPSYFVVTYLIDKGYDVLPINPGQAGKKIAGAITYSSLAGLPSPVDMVDIFRRAEQLPGIVSEILAMPELPKVVWMQLTIRDDAIARRLEAEGIKVVMNRCPKIEYGRHCGEIAWVGYNRRLISARKPILAQGYQHFGLDSSN